MLIAAKSKPSSFEPKIQNSQELPPTDCLEETQIKAIFLQASSLSFGNSLVPFCQFKIVTLYTGILLTKHHSKL